MFVDEYQDTNAVQDLIFRSVSDGGKNLFMVGDVKQSIYRFRQADPAIFLGKKRAFIPWPAPAEEPVAIPLNRNFRSRQEVTEGINFLFDQLMTEPFGGIDYRRESGSKPGPSTRRRRTAAVRSTCFPERRERALPGTGRRTMQPGW